MRVATLSLILISLVTADNAAAMDWRHYQNARFGTSADVPAGFAPAPPPENGDGQRFDGPNGDYRLRRFQISPVVSPGYRSFLKDTLESEGWKLTYTPSGENWFVLSGVNQGRILYQRVERPVGCKGDILHHIEFRYRPRWDGVGADRRARCKIS